MSETTQDNFLSPVQLETDSPHLELRKLAKSSAIEPQNLDFRIQNIVTYYKNEANPDPVFVASNEMNVFDDDEFFLDPTLEIKQSYHVEFFDLRKEPVPRLPKITIGVNSLITKVIATIHKTNECRYAPEYERLMFEYIAKQLMKAQILIGVRMGDLQSQLAKISSTLRVKDEIEEDIRLDVALGISPKKAVDGDIVYYYKQNLENESKDGKIDYAARGFLLGVSENELIIERFLPQTGRPGRDVRGKFISVAEPRDNVKSEINVSEAIAVEQGENSIKYIAKKSGYIHETRGNFDIQERLEINEVNFKTTGSIQTAMDANVTLVVKESDVIKDAIGAGVVVEAEEVEVKGNIGSNAIVKANRVQVGGQTHAKAKIYAKKAQVAIHIGYVEADEVEIDRLEGGSVMAKHVKLKSIVGGSVTANTIEIETLGSNCTLTAAHLIEVKYLRGTNNRFIIDTGKMKEGSEEVEKILEQMDELKSELYRLPKKLEAKKNIIDTNKEPIYAIKEKLEELARAKVAPPVTFMKKLKEYQELVGEYNAALREFKEKKEHLARLKVELEIMQNGIFSAKVINRGSWIEMNEIRFVLVDPPQNITYSTKQNEMARVISLDKKERLDGEIEYKIKKSNDLKDFERKFKNDDEDEE